MERISKIFKPYDKELILSWGIHPIALPLQFGIITSKGISKESGAKDIAKYYNLPFDEILGVGDTTSDWHFIKLCGYAAAMGNASNELKKLVSSKGKRHSYIGSSVDDNGIINIFKNFNLI